MCDYRRTHKKYRWWLWFVWTRENPLAAIRWQHFNFYVFFFQFSKFWAYIIFMRLMIQHTHTNTHTESQVIKANLFSCFFFVFVAHHLKARKRAAIEINLTLLIAVWWIQHAFILFAAVLFVLKNPLWIA